MSIGLDSMQQAFQDYLMDKDPSRIQALILDNTQMSAARRLEIYYDAYRLRLLEVLTGDFPKLQMLMGEEDFEHLGRRYIAAYPSVYFSVRDFGQDLPAFLQANEAYKPHPYFAEMAAFEWALGNTLDAANAEILSIEALKTLEPAQWGSLGLRFHPAFQILKFRWDIPNIWQAIENDEAPREPIQLQEALTWIVWRFELQSHFRSVNTEKALMLEMFETGARFGEICERLCEHMAEESVPAFALGFIQQCIAEGFVSALIV